MKFRAVPAIIAFSAIILTVACEGIHEIAEKSFQIDIIPHQASEFKSDLRNFADKGDYEFVDGSAETKNARKYMNEESRRLHGKNPGLVGQGIEIIDVTIEPKDSRSKFFIFAKTSAYDAGKVSVTVIFDDNSVAERQMAENFLESHFFRKWN